MVALWLLIPLVLIVLWGVSLCRFNTVLKRLAARPDAGADAPRLPLVLEAVLHAIVTLLGVSSAGLLALLFTSL